MANDPLLLGITVIGGICLAGVGYLLILQVRREKAVRQFRGMLTILANTHREGHSFEDAVGILADLGPYPARSEFRQLQKSIERGAGRDSVLEELAARLPCFESQYLAAALAPKPAGRSCFKSVWSAWNSCGKIGKRARRKPRPRPGRPGCGFGRYCSPGRCS